MKKLINFKNIVKQDKAVSILKSFVAKNIIGRTMLLSGIDGTGKKDAAIAFAAACNCQNNVSEVYRNSSNAKNQVGKVDACGACRTCRMITEGCHPDVLQMDFEGSTTITISDVRHLLKKISMKPYRSGHKAVIIPLAHRMSDEASNALFKFLEDHHEQITTILTVSSQINLTPAVVSHCHVIRFKPIDSDTIGRLLAKCDFEPEITKTVLGLSFGNLAKIKELSSQKWNDKRKWLISKISPLCCNMKDKMGTQEVMVLSEVLSKCPDMINDYLTIITLWLRDILVYKLNPKKIYNFDMQESISVASQNMNYAAVLSKVSIVQITQQDILKASVNLRLSIEAMLIHIYEST